MLLGKNPEFFRQSEKNLGFIKSSNGGDGGLHDRNESTLPGMPLPGIRAVPQFEESSNFEDQG
jgi:hypothetical protein